MAIDRENVFGNVGLAYGPHCTAYSACLRLKCLKAGKRKIVATKGYIIIIKSTYARRKQTRSYSTM